MILTIMATIIMVGIIVQFIHTILKKKESKRILTEILAQAGAELQKLKAGKEGAVLQALLTVQPALFMPMLLPGLCSPAIPPQAGIPARLF